MVDEIRELVVKLLFKSEFFFLEDYIIDCLSCFMVVEIICEKFMCFIGDELFYFIIVEIE